MAQAPRSAKIFSDVGSPKKTEIAKPTTIIQDTVLMSSDLCSLASSVDHEVDAIITRILGQEPEDCCATEPEIDTQTDIHKIRCNLERIRKHLISINHNAERL